MNRIQKDYQDKIKQKISGFYNIIKFSFEVFPPKDLILEEKLWASICYLKELHPSFFSVTYGANSGERKKTYDITQKIRNKTHILTSPHLTCAGLTATELQKIAEYYWNHGIQSVVALRGDINSNSYKHTMYAVDLVVLLKKVANFDISVAVYPELHPESKNFESEISNFQKKIDAGANRAITQFFFNVESYLNFRDRCVKRGINVEIIPGILPIYNFQQIQRFSSMTNVCIPDWIFKVFHGLENDISIQEIVGFNIVIDLVQKLYLEGVRHFHFYTLNRSDIVYSICHLLRFKNEYMNNAFRA